MLRGRDMLVGFLFYNSTPRDGGYFANIDSVVLGVLCTDPAYFRRGVGTDLIKWGLEIADKEDLPSYLEASKFGHALYSRLGFEDLEVLTVDMKKYGWEGEGDGMYSTWIMKRETPVSEESVHEKMSIDAITN